MDKNHSKEEEKFTILYVDDEPKNISSFKAVFRKDYKILSAVSAKEGFEMLEKETVHLIISDQKMPKITGTVFFKKILRSHPHVTRILLTGYSDMKDIVDAINEAEIFRYVNKPWTKAHLQEVIEQGLQQYQFNKEQRELVEKLEKNNKELDHFLYGAAHDLRAPVASLLGLVDLAKREDDLQGVKMILEMQTKTLQHMEELIEDVVEYSKNKYADLESSEIDFEQLIQNAFEFHQEYQNASTIEKRIELDLNSSFESDLSRIKVIFNNLVSNAIRYSDAEKEVSFVKIVIHTKEKEAYIEVEDNGIGIEEEHLPNIFEMFYRANAQQKGSGLGLFLVKESVLALKGEIEATSREGEGTVFKIKLPNLKATN